MGPVLILRVQLSAFGTSSIDLEEGSRWGAYLPPGFQHKKLTLFGM